MIVQGNIGKGGAFLQGGGGLLVAGSPYVANGWFGAGLGFMSAGLPHSADCSSEPRNNSNVFDQSNYGAASMASEMGAEQTHTQPCLGCRFLIENPGSFAKTGSGQISTRKMFY